MPAKNIFMVGIGGIGMSALAQLYKEEGNEVAGSDREESPTTELLESKGISVLIDQKAEHISTGIDMVVYSDAVPVDNFERQRGRELGLHEMSYFQALGEVSKGRTTIAVAGTHGKTTTAGMLAKILIDAGKSPTAIIGSIVKDFGSNYVPGQSDLFVIEACEYRDHLLEIAPKVLVITNLEWDHTDYFPTLAALQETFRKAIERVPEDGVIVTDPKNPNLTPLLSSAQAKVIDYTQEEVPELGLIGEFNKMNARAAKSAAKALFPDLGENSIDASLAAFQGTWRRFEYKGVTKSGAVVYDDYAHHPTAVRETIVGARERFPGKAITVAFHPHLYSRTRDLFDEFAAALATADSIILAPIYAAREIDDGTVSSDMLAAAIQKSNPHAISLKDFDAIEKELATKGSSDLVITMGAGDIYKVADRLVE